MVPLRPPGHPPLLINQSGLEVERTEYYPYGQIQSGGLEKYGFTGQENDADTELMYYGARYYSPEYRVFVQPDTMLPDVYDPQALNRYAYTLNNPVRYTDPSGHYVETAVDVAFIAMDLNDIRTGNANTWTYVGLGVDLVCLALPGATGGRLLVTAVEEAVTHGDELVSAGKAVNKGVGNTANVVTEYGDDTGEVLAKISSDVESKGIVGKNPGATGSLKHSAFKGMGEEWAAQTGKTNVHFEQSFNKLGDFVEGNPSGSVRPDSIEFMSGGVVNVYDLKTGNAKLRNPQMNKVAENLFGNQRFTTLNFHEVKNGQTTLVRTMTRE